MELQPKLSGWATAQKITANFAITERISVHSIVVGTRLTIGALRYTADLTLTVKLYGPFG